MSLVLQVGRILFAYFAACIISGLTIYAWLIFMDWALGYNQYEGFQLGLCIESLIIVFAVSIVPATVCSFIAERRSLRKMLTYGWTGLAISMWPFIPMFFIFPVFFIAPILGFASGCLIWLIAGRHAGAWKIVAS